MIPPSSAPGAGDTTRFSEGPAAAGDLPELLGLLGASGLPEAGLAGHLGTTRVLRTPDGRIIASGALEVYGDLALLRSVAVSADHRGEGLGRQITRALLELAVARGVEYVFLLTETAEGFFAGHGFEVVDRAGVPDAIRRTVEFSSACPESATVMRRPMGRAGRGSSG